MRVLVTGATGYIGGRLVPRLLNAGHEVRCLARTPDNLELQPWRDDVEVVQGDLLDAASVKEATADCDAAYYLVHHLRSGRDFADADRVAASNFSEAAEAAGVRRVVYLGMLGEPASSHSTLIASRHEVGRILASRATPVTELRAATIIGSGSSSFDMLRYLAEAAPVQITPRWVRTRCQPIAIADVLDVLVNSLDHDESRIVDLGGPDILSYAEMLRVSAQEVGKRRRVSVPMPVHSPRLSSYWVGLVTPLNPTVARPMIESLRSDSVVRASDRIIGSTAFRQAVNGALDARPGGVTTRWSDAGPIVGEPHPSDPEWRGGTTYLNRQVVPTDAGSDHLFWAFSRIGGDNGYYWLDWAWRMRAFLDGLVGGVGLRRGRRHPTDIRSGEAIDFWRVETVEPGQLLRLRAEMRLPGDAWLEWEARPTEDGADLVQSAWFRPRGLWGRMYWWMMQPAHRMVFPRMAFRIAAKGEERDFSVR